MKQGGLKMTRRNTMKYPHSEKNVSDATKGTRSLRLLKKCGAISKSFAANMEGSGVSLRAGVSGELASRAGELRQLGGSGDSIPVRSESYFSSKGSIVASLLYFQIDHNRNFVRIFLNYLSLLCILQNFTLTNSYFYP